MLGQLVEELIEFRGRVEVNRLGQVVLWTVIPNLVPLTVAALGVCSCIVAENKTNRRYTNLQKRILVGAAKKGAFRLAIGAHLDAHNGPDLAGGCTQCRVVDRLYRQNIERKKRPELIEVDVGTPFARRKLLGASQSIWNRAGPSLPL